MGSNPVGISASRGAAILGLSEFQTQLEVWQTMMEQIEPGFNEKNGMVLPVQEPSAVLRYGNAFELAIIALSMRHKNLEIIDRERVFSDKYMTCHVDGIYRDGAIHEGKTTNLFSFKQKWGENTSDAIPQVYQVQAQHILMLTKATHLTVSVLVFPDHQIKYEDDLAIVPELIDGTYWLMKNGKPIDPMKWADTLDDMGYFHQYEIEPNIEVHQLLKDAYAEFYEKNIIKKIAPEPKNYDDIKRLCPNPKGSIVVTEQLERWVSEYKDLSEELGGKGTLSKRKEELKVLILDTMRKMDKTIDDETKEKTILYSREGKKLISFNGKTFR